MLDAPLVLLGLPGGWAEDTIHYQQAAGENVKRAGAAVLVSLLLAGCSDGNATGERQATKVTSGWMEVAIAFGSAFFGVFLGVRLQAWSERKSRHIDRLRDHLVAPVETRLTQEYANLVPSMPAMTVRGDNRDELPRGVRGPFRPHLVREWMNHSWLESESWIACTEHWPDLAQVRTYLELRHDLHVKVNACFERFRQAYENASKGAATARVEQVGHAQNIALRGPSAVAGWFLDVAFDHEYIGGRSFSSLFTIRSDGEFHYAQGTYLPDAIFVCTRREDVVKCLGVLAKEMNRPDMRQGSKAAAELCARLEDALDRAHGATRAVLHEVRARGSCQSCRRLRPARTPKPR